MKALHFHGPGDLRLEDVPRPAPGAGDVLVEIEVALTDGTDLKTFRRGHPVLLGERPGATGMLLTFGTAGTVVPPGRCGTAGRFGSAGTEGTRGASTAVRRLRCWLASSNAAASPTDAAWGA